MTDKENLINLISDFVEHVPHEDGQTWEEACADHLIANGVTFAKDTNVPSKWISVEDRLPEPVVSVLVHMPMEKPFQTVREGFITKDGVWHSALYDREPGEVTHWQPMPEPPKEG